MNKMQQNLRSVMERNSATEVEIFDHKRHQTNTHN